MITTKVILGEINLFLFLVNAPSQTFGLMLLEIVMKAILMEASMARASGQELMVNDMKDITSNGREMGREF